MATNAKQNGSEKKETATTSRRTVQKKLADDATGKTPQPNKEVVLTKVNLDERINRFERLRGIANQRERLSNTLTELSRFNYNTAESSTFSIKDSAGLEFKTTNTNLITLVATGLQATLEARKVEIEKKLLEFKL